MAAVKTGQITLRDPLWQVMVCGSETGIL